MSFTPGPWVWRFKSGSLHRVGTDGYQFGQVVLTPIYGYDTGADTEVSEDDARLIAAAPDLLDALKRLEHEARYLCEQLAHRGLPGVPGDTVDMVLLAARAAIAKAEPPK